MQWTFENYRLDTDNDALWRDHEQLNLRPKTFDVLRYLVEHAGELVRKETLLENVWENSYVVEGVLTTSMSELRKLFGDTAKNQRFITTVYRRGYRFIATVNELQAATENADPESTIPSSAATASSDVSSFPRLPTMLGREQEGDELVEQLITNPDCRILSLVGPGGIGKTHLAIKVVRLISERDDHPFKDGFCFVQLHSQDDDSEFCSDINEALDLQSDGELSPQQHLQNFLRNKQMLLLIDNFEYYLESKQVLTELIKEAPGIKLVVTSRESLNVPDAWFHAVSGLDLSHSADAEAVRVFSFHAARNQPAFDINEKLPQVVRICELVEGMPLALELAASWLKMLSMDEVIKEISEGLDFLEDQSGDEKQRQGSIRAVINETWQRLTESEQTLLKQVSIFRNGADRAAISKIIGAGLPILARLVNKALLFTTQDNRYRMHELIRQFAEEKLHEDQEFEAETRQRHAKYYLRYIASQLEPMRSHQQGTVCRQVQADFDNVRNAWSWAVANRKFERLGDTLRCLSFFCDLRGHFYDGLGMFKVALEMVERSDYEARELLAARIKMRSAILNFRLSRYDTAVALFNEVLKHEELEYETTYALRFLGDYHFSHSGFFSADQARQFLEDCIERASRFNNLHIKTECLCQLAILYTNLILDIERSRQCAAQGLELARELGRPDLLINALDIYAWTINHGGDYAEAELLWFEALDLAVKSANRRNKALVTNWLGWSAWCVGGVRLDEAYERFREALQRYQDIGDRANMSMCCADLATVLLEQGNFDSAREHCKRGLDLAQEIGRDDHYVYNLYVLGALETATGELEQARTHLLESRRMAWEQEEQTNKPVVVYYIMQLLYAEFLAEPDKTDPDRLANIGTVLLFLQVYPPTWQAFKDRSKKFQQQIESEARGDPFAKAKGLSDEELIETALKLVPEMLGY